MESTKLEIWLSYFDSEKIRRDKLQEYLEFIVSSSESRDCTRYSEWHHVMPKCIDRERRFVDEVVLINGSDHVRAHRKLLDVFSSGDARRRLGYALHMMLRSPCSQRYEGLSDDEYEESKRSWSQSVVGRKVSDETRMKISQTLGDGRLKGEKSPRYGSHLSEESRRLISRRNKEAWTDEKKAEFSSRRSGKGNPCYGKKLIRTPVSEESRMKMSLSGLGKIWINNGSVSTKIRSDEEIPEGRVRGRVSFSRKSNGQEGKIWINNGLVSRKIPRDQSLPEGWVRGRCRREDKVC